MDVIIQSNMHCHLHGDNLKTYKYQVLHMLHFKNSEIISKGCPFKFQHNFRSYSSIKAGIYSFFVKVLSNAYLCTWIYTSNPEIKYISLFQIRNSCLYISEICIYQHNYLILLYESSRSYHSLPALGEGGVV